MVKVVARCGECQNEAPAKQWFEATKIHFKTRNIEPLTMITDLEIHYYVCPTCGKYNDEGNMTRKLAL